ncbi:MAG TPA: undecaprenyl-phosphate glucose phosphotransferase [Casimicrobiaceae bacterium]|jgi:putative colanic acid biosynthesis UDP-glucose lipid carrier transferase|nr:undecaprenyl-phosphate glucose phosphotransferase [Casimicrobiaceae bacterium]
MFAPRNLLKSNATTFDRLLRIVDPLVIVIVGWVIHVIYLDSAVLPANYWVALLGAALLSVVVFPETGLYRPKRGASLADDLRALTYGWSVVVALGISVAFLTKTSDSYSRVWVASSASAGLLVHAALRVALRLALRWLRRRGYNLRHVCIVGAGELAREVVTRLREAPWSGLVVRALYDDAPALAGASIEGVPVRGPIAQLGRDLEAGGIDQVWIALPLRDEDQIRRVATELRGHSVQIRYVPDIFGFELLRHSFSEIAGMPVIGLSDTPIEGTARMLKTAEDYVLGGFLLVIASPLFVIIALAILATSGAPVFYRQTRVTSTGRQFTMLKFRTMAVNAETQSGPVWSGPDTGRGTSFSRMLRRYSLDELPQLINVLSGDMSLVGPRPERPEFIAQFRKDVPGYMQKHLVKAGITGWAQVNDLRGSSDLPKRIQYDLYYIDNWSLWFDLRILALTIMHIFRSRNAY